MVVMIDYATAAESRVPDTWHMTIFAGIFALDLAHVISDDRVQAMCAALSRYPGDSPRAYSYAGFACAAVDVGIHDTPSDYAGEDGAISLMAGEPLLRADRQTGISRYDDLRRLHWAARSGDRGVLRASTGSYCAINYDPRARRLLLWSDKLGARPLYFSRDDRFFYFSTTLRVLESMIDLELGPDLQGLAEIASFGYALGDRTPYIGVHLAGPGQLIDVTSASMTTDVYWDWNVASGTARVDASFTRRLFESFNNAVERRLGGRQSAVALLSGGLDSRCIVASLRASGAGVHTIAFGPRGCADVVYAERVAAALETCHFRFDGAPFEFWARQAAAHAHWRRENEPELPDRPGQVWSGDGGNESIGLVAINDRMVSLLHEGRTDDAIAEYLRRESIGLPARIFQRTLRARICELPSIGVRESMARLTHPDPVRRFQLFLLQTEARRRLHSHLEDIDLRRFEFITPFMDADFVQLVLSVRAEDLLRHELYHQWLEEFAPPVKSVPWQVYPGHAPCPVPQISGAVEQSNRTEYGREERRAERHESLDRFEPLLDSPRFPGKLLRRPVLRTASWLTGLGLRDYSYQFRSASVFIRHAEGKRSAVPAEPECQMAWIKRVLNSMQSDRWFGTTRNPSHEVVRDQS